MRAWVIASAICALLLLAESVFALSMFRELICRLDSHVGTATVIGPIAAVLNATVFALLLWSAINSIRLGISAKVSRHAKKGYEILKRNYSPQNHESWENDVLRFMREERFFPVAERVMFETIDVKHLSSKSIDGEPFTKERMAEQVQKLRLIAGRWSALIQPPSS